MSNMRGERYQHKLMRLIEWKIVKVRNGRASYRIICKQCVQEGTSTREIFAPYLNQSDGHIQTRDSISELKMSPHLMPVLRSRQSQHGQLRNRFLDNIIVRYTLHQFKQYSFDRFPLRDDTRQHWNVVGDLHLFANCSRIRFLLSIYGYNK